MLKLGVLGGTFNPIHIGHLIIAQYVLEEFNLDKIIFIPTGKPPHKNSTEIEGAGHRLNMIREAIKDNDKFIVSDMELKREGVTYTYDTLCELNSTYKEASIHFIVGYDTLLDMKNWKRFREVIQLSNFVVVNRDSDINEIINSTESFYSKYNKKIEIVNVPNIGVSSSEIRKKIRENKNVMYMVTRPVYDYILQNNLYRGDFI